jgi:phage tail sheath protein FI
MPVQVSYPGVYIEEIPSGVRTITGVATSITAFIGRAKRGPVDEAKTINSFADYERIFGGLDLNSTMSYVVRDFYLNGGSQAIIVRLYHAETDDNPKPSKTKIVVDGVKLEAAYEGSWGAYLRAEVDLDVSEEVASSLGLSKADLFNLTVRDASSGGDTEKYLNLSFKESARRVDRVLEAGSKLVRWDGVYPAADSLPTASKAVDAVTAAEITLEAAKNANPQVPDDITDAEAALKAAKDALETSDGENLKIDDFVGTNFQNLKKGLYVLEQADLFNLLCLPPYTGIDAAGKPADVDNSLIAKANTYCEKRRAMLLVDSPSSWTDKDKAKTGINAGVGWQESWRVPTHNVGSGRLRQV